MSIVKKIHQAILTLKNHLTQPLHIEFVVTDYCNLNCKGCGHYSSLVPEQYEPLAQLEQEMAQISKMKNFHLLHDVYLIGGETLLYPQLNQATRLARKYFPNNKLHIFTNGLKLPKMDSEFWQTCRETNTCIALTRYPIKFDYDAAEQLCRDNGVEVNVFGDRSQNGSFFRFALDKTKSQNKWLAHFRCYNFGCVSIVDSKIFPCSISGCVTHLNNKFGTNFQWQDGDYIPVNNLTDAKQILRLRNRPVPFCAYCKKITITPYGPSRRTPNEWLD